MKLVLGTRGSSLARAQTDAVAAALRAAGHEIEVHPIVTRGDRRLDKTIPELGGMGLFTAELDAALREGSIHVAVHSFKDVPTSVPMDAIPAREDPRDALVGRPLEEGGRFGTASLRRQSWIRARYPQCEVVPLRGNIDSRIARVRSGEFDGIVIAAAGLHRLDRHDEIDAYLDMVPAPAQGALAVQAVDDDEVRAAVRVLHDPATARLVAAERNFLRVLEGGCSVPVGALATDDPLTLRGFVGAPDGSRAIEDTLVAGDPDAEPEALGEELARRMLEAGAKELLA